MTLPRRSPPLGPARCGPRSARHPLPPRTGLPILEPRPRPRPRRLDDRFGWQRLPSAAARSDAPARRGQPPLPGSPTAGKGGNLAVPMVLAESPPVGRNVPRVAHGDGEDIRRTPQGITDFEGPRLLSLDPVGIEGIDKSQPQARCRFAYDS